MIVDAEEGARWLRCDLHSHTPFDTDRTFGENVKHAIEAFKKGNPQRLLGIAERYVESCRNACNGEGLDLVALTDHNTIDGFAYLKPQFDALTMQANTKGLKMPAILPGVEFSIGGERPIHFIVIFAANTKTDEIDGAIRHVFGTQDRFDPKMGTPRATGQSVDDFLGKLYAYCCPPTGDRELSFVVLPAHADGSSGIGKETGATKKYQVASEIWDEMRGHLRQRVITRKDWHGFQTKKPYSQLPEAFRDLLCQWIAAKKGFRWEELPEATRIQIRTAKHWPLIECSDPHSKEDIGSRYTWLKMEIGDVEGIRLALLDPESRLRSMTAGIPGKSYPRIRSLKIAGTDFFEEIKMAPNACLTTLIGGRGTGKSTVIECLRYALDRAREDDFDEDEREIRDALDALLTKKPSRDFGETKGILLPEHNLEVDLVIADKNYLVKRTTKGIEIHNSDGDLLDLDIRSLIAPRILSQKQIARIARDPAAQRRELDALSDVESSAAFADKRPSLIQSIESLQSRRKILKERLASLPAKATELQKVQDKIELLEKGANKELLERYAQFQAEEQWFADIGDRVKACSEASTLHADALESNSNEIPPVPEGPTKTLLSDLLEKVRAQLSATATQVRTQKEALTALEEEIEKQRENSWQPQFDPIKTNYEALRHEMEEKGVVFGEHDRLLQRRGTLQREIAELNRQHSELDTIEDQVKAHRSELVELHESRLAARRSLADNLEHEDADIRLEIVPFGDKEQILSARSEWFGGAGLQERDWSAIVDCIFSPGGSIPERLKQFIESLRTDLEATKGLGKALTAETSAVAKWLGSDVLTRNFFNSLLRAERVRVDDIERFLPEDRVEAKVRGSDGLFKPISQGSVGQRSMAILGLLLTAGDQPLIVDQPEEDLDNQYVYNVVVDLLRKRKFSRQIIIATHNANIPVNGDAELIVALGVENRLGVILTAGSIDRNEVKDSVSLIMEGSREAFRLRRERYGY